MDSFETIICTVLEGDYVDGAGALINSLHAFGFKGKVVVGYRGDLSKYPLFKHADNLLPEISVTFEELSTKFHLTNYKPYFMKYLREQEENREKNIVYLDPDIVLNIDWSFFETWIKFGVAVSADPTLETSPSTDPRRLMWRDIAHELGREWRPIESYANAGFVGVSSAHAQFIYDWCEAMDALVDRGYLDPTMFHYNDPKHPFMACDQDVMNFCLNSANTPYSLTSSGAMGFGKGPKYLLHSIGAPKPWQSGHFRAFLKSGRVPGVVITRYWDFVRQPIPVAGKLRRSIAKAKFRVIKLLSIFRP